MDLEEKRRNEADEKAAETARIAAEAALKAKTGKYLPALPVIDHSIGKRMRLTFVVSVPHQDHEIDQSGLAADVVARSAKLFYLIQSLAK
ncbi:hypothetical protein AK812_SmicGene7234 [Symbiodinium microadriaticum]|uniref:Uncharacterized protein n=1 Tax=Symbiodinium microadriaticum TaxID=2951 RepID=A0A1Q9EP52_SYMMI|nr:hypothetical protein AK812_SmicGene7234 [Symbiodinium microadriaticum]